MKHWFSRKLQLVWVKKKKLKISTKACLRNHLRNRFSLHVSTFIRSATPVQSHLFYHKLKVLLLWVEGCSFLIENTLRDSNCQIVKAQWIYYEFVKVDSTKYDFKNLPKVLPDFKIIWTKLIEKLSTLH